MTAYDRTIIMNIFLNKFYFIKLNLSINPHLFISSTLLGLTNSHITACPFKVPLKYENKFYPAMVLAMEKLPTTCHNGKFMSFFLQN